MQFDLHLTTHISNFLFAVSWSRDLKPLSSFLLLMQLHQFHTHIFPRHTLSCQPPWTYITTMTLTVSLNLVHSLSHPSWHKSNVTFSDWSNENPNWSTGTSFRLLAPPRHLKQKYCNALFLTRKRQPIFIMALCLSTCKAGDKTADSAWVRLLDTGAEAVIRSVCVPPYSATQLSCRRSPVLNKARSL